MAAYTSKLFVGPGFPRLRFTGKFSSAESLEFGQKT